MFVSLIFPVRLSAFAYLPIAFWSSQSPQISLDMHTVREHIRVSSKRFWLHGFVGSTSEHVGLHESIGIDHASHVSLRGV